LGQKGKPHMTHVETRSNFGSMEFVTGRRYRVMRGDGRVESGEKGL
jgi:hypothetical protein